MRLSFLVAPVFLIAAAALSFSSADAYAQQDALRVAISDQPDYPFTFKREGQWEGYEVELIRAVALRLGMEAELRSTDSSRLLALVEFGEVDTVAARIEASPELRSRFAVTQPYIYSGAQIIVRRGDESIGALGDLRGKTVAVIQGSPYHELIRALPYASDIDIQTGDTRIAQQVAIGRADAFVADRLGVLSQLRRQPLPLQLTGRLLSDDLSVLPFASSAEGQALRNRVDDAITELKLDGTLEALSQRWFDVDITRP